MAGETNEEAKVKAAEQEALAAEAKTKLDKEQALLKQQQAELRSLQVAVADYGKTIIGLPASQQQAIANTIVDLQKKIKRLQNVTIPATNQKVNEYATQVSNYQAEAEYYNTIAKEGDPNTSTETPDQEPELLNEVNYNPPFASGPSRDELGNLTPGWVSTPDGDVYVGGAEDGIVPSVFSPTPTEPYSQSRDELNELNPGWVSTPNGDVYVGAAEDGLVTTSEAISASAPNKGLTINKNAGQGANSNQSAKGTKNSTDWRVRLSLSDSDQAKYFYNLSTTEAGLLAPLKETKGVIFPYVPNITISYAAAYDASDVTHSNYKIFSYRQSSVDSISISCDFTAQDTNEANYLLAVIHFFRSVTKMFYGRDQTPKPGTPPPLCYLSGLGAFQFNNHPLVITNFNYTLPTDVDYIRATNFVPTNPGTNQSSNNAKGAPTIGVSRMGPGLTTGGNPPGPEFTGGTAAGQAQEPTYVPTSMQIQIQALPIVTRNDVSNKFSLREYAKGSIYRGIKGDKSRGIW